MIAGCSPDLPNYEIKHLRIVRTYPRNNCVEMYYDLDDDKIIDVIEFRRWNPSKGIISGPFGMVWDKNKDMVISREEGYRRPDPIPLQLLHMWSTSR